MRFAKLLLLLLAGAVWVYSASAVAWAAQTPARFDVRAFGATGNGIADDQPAIIRAVEAVTKNKGGVLYFPYGVYRCARQAGAQNGIEFDRVSNVTILFDPGAVLLMDNLNPQTGGGDRGHGILFCGPCENISLINASVKWAKRPTSRSMGDAFRFEGFPSDDRCISNIHFLNCSAENSPQVGAIFMGCSDIDVENFRVTRTRADDLHFNACRRIHVNGLTAIDTGDDSLSFMTYEDDKAVNEYTGGPGSYAAASLGEWNSNGSTATNIYAKGGTANGVRFGGAINVALSNVVVEGKLRAIIADCGKKDPPKASWSWLASRQISISNVVAINCATGFYVWNYNNQPLTGDDKWWRSDIQLSNLTARDCTSDSIYICDAAGVTVRGAKAENQKIRILHARDCTLDGVELNNGEFLIKDQHDATGLANAPDMNVVLRNIEIDNGYLGLENDRGLTCTDVRITNPIDDGLRISYLLDSRLDGISIK
ncbi:MAG TPA: glycosyl hydrolase family 28-related protein, partial [Tepidisphaeraceae bacterium]|nr:glycosyl hydrolase family 28-related protein [Tepidisphaeraceae bacterium]